MREPPYLLALLLEISQVSDGQAKHNASNTRSPSPRLQNYTKYSVIENKIAKIT